METLPTPLVKICGTTSLDDAQLSVAAGADYLGYILHPPSPRFIPLESAVEIAALQPVPAVAVTVNKSLDELLEIHRALSVVVPAVVLQLHGDEPASLVQTLTGEGIRVWGVASGSAEAVRQRVGELTEAGAEAVLLDVREVSSTGEIIYGGTGHVGDWNLARQLVEEGYRIVLAGGLTPQNVARGIETVHPWGIDVASGVEASKGKKDPDKVRAFISNAGLVSSPHQSRGC